ncbi:glycosyltransferase [Aliifodinibius sp. S!AR15-10]|uniref:glycosyltransferase family 2 protein n=1 Tax=Aliifodinibius sp. S!AR15-10 TaxID=2950437 RepID=UPI00285F3E86|nr:glycosyltransferase family 2 protein [Aliifodinibius sp. S!AR15-10]MDR8392916.1 glycosyltransferase [Aliifodinibius sp. S!AR15-10]
MKEQSTHITVIIPTYNMAAYLPEAIDSVQKSSFGDLDVELFVVDDGSTDETPAVVEELMRNQTGEGVPIRYTHEENLGKSAAVNRALNEAKGQYITILDADDKLPKDSLQLRHQRAQETGAELVFGGFSTFNGNRVLGHRSPPSVENKRSMVDELLFNIKSPFHQNSMLISRALIKKVGSYDERLLRGQDKDYAIRLLTEADSVEIINKAVYLYRRYERGYLSRLKNRLLTIRYKWLMISKHTKGIKRILVLFWGFIVEVGKMGYEFFSMYKK